MPDILQKPCMVDTIKWRKLRIYKIIFPSFPQGLWKKVISETIHWKPWCGLGNKGHEVEVPVF